MTFRAKATSAAVVLFAAGFALGHFQAATTQGDAGDRRVTGIGGVFFKAKDPAKLKQWYATHLGLHVNKYGTVFEWRQADGDGTRKGFTQWSAFADKTTYFKPSEKDYMINYRVEDMDRLVAQLNKEGVALVDKVQAVDYGKFCHIMDPEGNKIELWEPNDEVYDKMGGERTK
jgi:predicted enzyme related to lactoylglutathione lyase